MKKVIIVSKTHLDLGFTDFAENIKAKYIDAFIPNAIQIANEINDDNNKKFIWTTGSWIIKEALKNSSVDNKNKLISALKNGNIAPHAMPFTLHTELLDKDSIEYGLSITDEIDKITGTKTIAAKMTDVPGHTKALVPILHSHGIKLLHIGVNGASAMPNVPECFLWKVDDAEIIVIYSGSYGGEYKNEYIDDILYFDHTLDNHGASGSDAVLDNIKSIQKKYPDYKVTAGRLDDYAAELWKVRDKLPVITSEIGDSWIHGSATDPYKSAALRTLIGLKNKWLKNNTISKTDDEYICLADNILCLAEHTCGMDVKIALGDYEHYLKKDFNIARQLDTVKMKSIHRTFSDDNTFSEEVAETDTNDRGSYSKIEQSWLEQREYINNILIALSDEHKKEAVEALSPLMPLTLSERLLDRGSFDCRYTFKKSSIELNKFGGIKALILDGKSVIKENCKPCVTYHSYGKKDYDFWLTHYTRDIKETAVWSIADFARPLIDRIDDKFKQGRFSYTLYDCSTEKSQNELKILVNLKTDEYCSEELGAAREIQIIYTLTASKLNIELSWFNKDANRLTESTMLHIYPNCNDNNIKYIKLGEEVNPFDIVENGNRNLAAVEKVLFTADDNTFEIVNCHSPLVSIGSGKILQFDNKYESVLDGLTYILHNNVWGTNFPLWYENNAYFKFEISAI